MLIDRIDVSNNNLQEKQLIFTQLKWLLNISQNLVTTISKTDF